MKKKFISIAKKAMVWTMAASMLVATPLTASASGLSDIYKTEDQWGNNIGTDGKVHNETDENGKLINFTGDASRTGTVTSTNTNSSILDNANSFDGIMIKPQDIERNQDAVGTEETVEVVLTKGNADGTISEIAVPEEMQGRFTWKSSNTSVATFASAVDRKTNTMKLQIKGGGRATITVSLDDYKNDLHYSDTINVLIKQKATKIAFSKELQEDAFAGDSLVLDEYVELYPEGSTDEVTYALVANSAHKATLKNGVLKLNAKSAEGEKLSIIAIGDEVRSDVTEIEINRTIPATDATFTVSTTKGTSPEIKKNKTYNWLINNDGMSGTAVIKMTGKDNGSVVESTDRIVSWTSKKPDIVAVETIARNSDNKKGLKVTLVPKAVGTAQIVAKTGRGKSFTFKVTVKADLKGVELPDNMQAYSGQMVQLTATQKFTEHGKENFTDAGLKWDIIGKDGEESKAAAKAAKKVATVKNGLLTVKPDIKDVKSIMIKACGSKRNTRDITSGIMTVELKQVNVKKIVVYPNANNLEGAVDNNVLVGAIAAVELRADGKKVVTTKKYDTKKPISVAVGDKKTFALYAEAEVDGQPMKNAAEVLGWTVNNTKLAKAVKNSDPASGSIAGVKKGSVTITVSGSTLVNNKYKATKISMKTSVTQPSKTIQLTSKKAVLSGKNVSFKATLEKGSSTKAKDLEWTATNLTTNEKTVFKNGKWKVTYPVGTEVLIRARVKETGISASMRLYVVNKSNKVTINDKDGNAISGNKYALDASTIKAVTDLPTFKPMIDGNLAGSNNHTVAEVNYTMNKQDYVRIVKNADGTITLKPIQNGTVKITPVSADGKKGKALTVTVTNVNLQGSAEGALYSIQ